MHANDHPYRVTAVDSAAITANDHPFKVLIEGGVVTPEQFAELEAKVAALATDLTYKGGVDTFGDLPATADDGDTYLVTSTGILYTFVNNDPIPLNEGVNVVQTTGTSTTDVMSQNAVTSMIYAQPGSTLTSGIRIGLGVTSSTLGSRAIAIATQTNYPSDVAGANAIGIGFTPVTYADNAIAIGARASATGDHSIAFGGDSSATATGEMNIGAYRQGVGNVGYNGSAYRLLSGLYDGQSAHDAATVGQLTATLTNSQFNSILENA